MLCSQVHVAFSKGSTGSLASTETIRFRARRLTNKPDLSGGRACHPTGKFQRACVAFVVDRIVSQNSRGAFCSPSGCFTYQYVWTAQLKQSICPWSHCSPRRWNALDNSAVHMYTPLVSTLSIPTACSTYSAISSFIYLIILSAPLRSQPAPSSRAFLHHADPRECSRVRPLGNSVCTYPPPASVTAPGREEGVRVYDTDAN
jgi:hypothetical protein